MDQNLYAAEANDRGWYRVDQEKKKLEVEVERLEADNKYLREARSRLMADNIKLDKLREALEEIRHKHFPPMYQCRITEICNEALKEGK